MKRKLLYAALLGSFFTVYAQEAATVPYEFGFDSAASASGWTMSEFGWSFYPHEDVFTPSHQGTGLVTVAGGIEASDEWLFSRGVSLDNGQIVEVSYYMRKVTNAGIGGENPLKVTIGTSATAGGQATVLETYDDVVGATYQKKTHTFTAPASGVYYIGFHYTAPEHTAANNGRILIDTFSVKSAVAGISENLYSGLEIFPNPSNNVIQLLAPGLSVKHITLTDLNGSIVKTIETGGVNETMISVADMSAGVYFVNIASDKGTISRKIIKN